jgi:hypothetical protein
MVNVGISDEWLEMGFDAVGELVAFFAGKRGGHKFHYARIGVYGGEGLAVGREPAAKN